MWKKLHKKKRMEKTNVSGGWDRERTGQREANEDIETIYPAAVASSLCPCLLMFQLNVTIGFKIIT